MSQERALGNNKRITFTSSPRIDQSGFLFICLAIMLSLLHRMGYSYTPLMVFLLMLLLIRFYLIQDKIKRPDIEA